MNEITVNLTTRAFFRLSYPEFLILTEKQAATIVFENALLFGTFHLSTLLLYKAELPTISSWQVLSPLPGQRGEKSRSGSPQAQLQVWPHNTISSWSWRMLTHAQLILPGKSQH